MKGRWNMGEFIEREPMDFRVWIGRGLFQESKRGLSVLRDASGAEADSVGVLVGIVAADAEFGAALAGIGGSEADLEGDGFACRNGGLFERLDDEVPGVTGLD